VGASVLERGGNAVDAAVATAFALAVTYPSAGNLGGGGFMLVRARGGSSHAIDFRETAPLALTRESFERMQRGGALGGAAAGVPGSVKGLLLAAERLGRLPRAELISPAIELAERGFVLGQRQAELLAASFKLLSADATLRARFGRAGKPAPAGTRINQPELARSLARIRDLGSDGFYTGETARALASAPGSLIRQEDLDRYRVELRNPLAFTYRGFQIETMPPPSAGGVAIAEMLGVLELLQAHTHPKNSPTELHLFLEASRRAQADRRFGVVDPDTLSPAERELALSRYLDARALLLRAPIDAERKTPSAELAPLYPGASEEAEQTTHLSVVDSSGMVVSLTTTLSGSFGAKLTAPGTGIVLNNSVASFSRTGLNQPQAGRRTTSSMAPTLVLDHGRVRLVLGTPGGDTIPSTIVQVLRGVIDYGLTLDAAVQAPRIHQGFLPDRARYESRKPLPKAVLSALGARGHSLLASHIAMGDSNNLLLDGELAYGVADTRGGGLALAAAAPVTSSD
jgi:gamma-glutamyltranspeptidase/glutathione hydrolase